MKFHIGRDDMVGGLRIYAISDDGAQAMVISEAHEDGNGLVVVSMVDVPEGTQPPPFLVLGHQYATEFEAGFMRFIGARDHIVPKEVYEREAARVDALLGTLQHAVIVSLPAPETTTVERQHFT
jgi:hypothetical protein